MFVMDMPDAPPQYAMIVIAKISQSQGGNSRLDGIVGVCDVIQNTVTKLEPGEHVPAPMAPFNLGPAGTVKNYIYQQEKRVVEATGSITVLEQPTHGTVNVDVDGNPIYVPPSGYAGTDDATLLVEMDGRKFKMVYSLHVLTSSVTYLDQEDLCPKFFWKISVTSDGLITARLR